MTECTVLILIQVSNSLGVTSVAGIRWTAPIILTTQWYHCTLVPFSQTPMPKPSKTIEIERVQTGVRVERRLLKVLKALADYKNMTLGDLLEGIVLHAFEGKAPFSAETLRKIGELKGIYDLDLDASASHRLKERS
jgi:hypothetical protein